MDTSVPRPGHRNFPVIFQDLEVQVIIVISFTSVQVEVTKKKGFQDFRSGDSDFYIPITNRIYEIPNS